VPGDPYAGPVTGVLRNKLGLETAEELAAAEREITHAALILVRESPVRATYNLPHLRLVGARGAAVARLGYVTSLVMELHQLEYFVAVAEEASFTRAAERVHVAQPGVSAQVRRLESELGQQLLDRSGRSVRLTEVGTAVLPFARAALDAVANARPAVDELAGLIRGQVTVGMVSGCALPILAELLASFHQAYPGVSIALTEQNSDRLIELLKDNQLDLALIGAAGDATADVQTSVILEEELVALVDSSHPLAASAAGPGVTLTALRDVPLISLPRGTGVRMALDAACAGAGFTPNIVLEASALPMVVQLATQGLGLAVVPASAADAATAAPAADAPPGPRILRITSPPLRSRLELAWNSVPPASPAARVLAEHAQRFLRRLRTT
jgi:DNA-binding transcriptional LysR family regulator